MIMRPDEMIWKAVDRRRAEFIAWARREFSVALRVQFNQWEKATGGSVEQGEMIRAVESMSDDSLAVALSRVYERVAGVFAVETEKTLVNRNQAKSLGYKDKSESDYQDQIRAWITTEGSEKIVGMGKTSKDLMRRIIGQAFEQGLSVEDTVRVIRSKYQDMTKVRAERIARTEIVGSSNMGAVMGAEKTGLSLMKQWISTQDDRTRRSPYDHLDANLTMVEMKGLFNINGDQIRFPGDPQGQPGNIINCRCTVVFVEAQPAQNPVIQPRAEEVVDDFTVGWSAVDGKTEKYRVEYEQTVRETLRDLNIKGKVDISFEIFKDATRGSVQFGEKPGSAGIWTCGGSRVVRMNVKNTLEDGLKTVKHELRHVWQGDTDTFIMKEYNGKMWMFWEGQMYMTVQQYNNIVKNMKKATASSRNNWLKYNKFPWEVDARKYAGQEI